MSGLWTPWDSAHSDDDEWPEYDADESDGPQARMWRSVASAAASFGFVQSACPCCEGKGWVWVTSEGRWRDE